jgi:hypothetical protein
MIHSLLISKDQFGMTLDSQYHQLPDNYDGDQYGDTVPFTVGSNQYIVTYDTKAEAMDDKAFLDSANGFDEEAEHRAFLVWLDPELN